MRMSKNNLHFIAKIIEFHAILHSERFAYFAFGGSKKSMKGVISFPGMNNTRLKEKILIILDFENGFLPTYLQLCSQS